MKAIIPARGGSKGIFRKNIKLFKGKPLIAWTIEVALKSGLEPIVSTEDSEISEVAKKYGATVVERPEHLAQDDTSVEAVLKYHVKEDEDAILLLPTCPLRTEQHIHEAIKIFKDTDCVFSVSPLPSQYHPEWLIRDLDGQIVNNIYTDIRKMPRQRQALPPLYFKNDIIFVFKGKNLYDKYESMFGEKQKLYITEDLGDLNTLEDWAKYET